MDGIVLLMVKRPANHLRGFFLNVFLVGGFNPFEKYESNWIICSSRGENKNG